MLKQMFKSIGIAFDGIIDLIKSENNAKIHLISTIVVIIVGFKLQFLAIEWLWISLAIAGVWVAELINTAIEKLTDLISPEQNPIAKKNKRLCRRRSFSHGDLGNICFLSNFLSSSVDVASIF